MPNEHAGHRQRMYKKLREESLPEQELLEVMLFPLLPRRNTNDLAHRLLSRFGSLRGIFWADVEELEEVEGIGTNIANAIFCIGKAQKKCMCERKKEGFHTEAFIEKIYKKYQGLPYEIMDAYLLDEEGTILSQFRFSDYKERKVAFHAKEFATLLVKQVGVSGVVLVHNHPVGRAKPSTKDDETTKQAQLVCNVHDVLLCDHIVFSYEGAYSYYLSGRMSEISKSYSLTEIAVAEKEEG